MIKTFCDICKKETTKEKTDGFDFKCGKYKCYVQIKEHGYGHTPNICKLCLIKALKRE